MLYACSITRCFTPATLTEPWSLIWKSGFPAVGEAQRILEWREDVFFEGGADDDNDDSEEVFSDDGDAVVAGG